MSKYIDADKLKTRLRNSIKMLQEGEPTNEITRIIGERHIETYNKLLSFIDSLQQEQPEVDIEKEYAEFVEADPVYSKLVSGLVGKLIARHFAEWGAIHLNARKEE